MLIDLPLFFSTEDLERTNGSIEGDLMISKFEAVEIVVFDVYSILCSLIISDLVDESIDENGVWSWGNFFPWVVVCESFSSCFLVLCAGVYLIFQ